MTERAKLNVIQASILMHFVTVSMAFLLMTSILQSNERNMIVNELTSNIYAVFNGVDTIKDCFQDFFSRFSCFPKKSLSETTKSVEFTGFRGPITEQRSALTFKRRKVTDDLNCSAKECIIFDFVLTTYDLELRNCYNLNDTYILVLLITK